MGKEMGGNFNLPESYYERLKKSLEEAIEISKEKK